MQNLNVSSKSIGLVVVFFSMALIGLLFGYYIGETLVIQDKEACEQRFNECRDILYRCNANTLSLNITWWYNETMG